MCLEARKGYRAEFARCSYTNNAVKNTNISCSFTYQQAVDNKWLTLTELLAFSS